MTYTAQASGAPALHVGSAALSHISDVTHHSMSCVMKCSVTLSQKKVIEDLFPLLQIYILLQLREHLKIF